MESRTKRTERETTVLYVVKISVWKVERKKDTQRIQLHYIHPTVQLNKYLNHMQMKENYRFHKEYQDDNWNNIVLRKEYAIDITQPCILYHILSFKVISQPYSPTKTFLKNFQW